jgi:hypothetical protein
MADNPNGLVLWWQRRSTTQKVLVGVGGVGVVALGAFVALPALFSALTAAITAEGAILVAGPVTAAVGKAAVEVAKRR